MLRQVVGFELEAGARGWGGASSWVARSHTFGATKIVMSPVRMAIVVIRTTWPSLQTTWAGTGMGTSAACGARSAAAHASAAAASSAATAAAMVKRDFMVISSIRASSAFL
jgi:hypothetical protein